MSRGKVIRRGYITREMVRADPGTLFVFGDNMAKRGYGGQAAEMRGEANALGLPTKWKPERAPDAYFSDSDWRDIRVRFAIKEALTRMDEHLLRGGDLVIPSAGLGTGLAELPRRAPRIHAYIEAVIGLMEVP